MSQVITSSSFTRCEQKDTFTSPSFMVTKLHYCSSLLKSLDFKPTKLKLLEKLSDATEHLGVLIDYKLSWKNHVDSIALKISKTIGLLPKLRHFVPHHTLVKVPL